MIQLLLLSLFVSAPQAESLPEHARVLMIGLDGVRPDALQAAKTPNLDYLSAHGQLTLTGRSTSITSSGPAWTSILTGARMLLHGVHDNSFEGANTQHWPTWLAQLESARPEAFSAAISQWSPIHEHLTQGTLDYSIGAPSGAEVTRLACELLSDPGKDLRGLFLHYDDVDAAGHSRGYSPEIPEYLAAIEQLDAELGKVLDALRSRSSLLFEDWLILVGTDHGGKGTEHGADIPECRTVFQLATNLNLEGFSWRKNAEVVDFAGLALTHLGLRGSCIPAARPFAWWRGRNQQLNQRAAAGPAKLLFIGDSITQGWEDAGAGIWDQVYAPQGALNLGLSGDRTEHVLWRLRHGNLEQQAAEVAVLMIGTNNSSEDSSEEIARGVQAIVAELLVSLPRTQILLLAIFPRGHTEEDRFRRVNAGANQLLAPWAAGLQRVHFLDINASMLAEDGSLLVEIMPDLLHLNAKGYEVWARSMAATLERLRSLDKPR